MISPIRTAADPNTYEGAAIARTRLRNSDYKNFSRNVEAALRERFLGFGHAPSPEHWSGLRAIIKTIEAMALGVAGPKYFLSALPTGMGKTTTLIEATKELIRVGQRTGNAAGIIILTNTLDQIPVLVQQMELADDQFAVRVGKTHEELNSLGVGEDSFPGEGRHQSAQVLFTTQQKLLALRSQGLNFKHMRSFYFQGRPRSVRVWDEAIYPACEIVLSADDIDRLKSPLAKAGYKEQRDALEAFVAKMKNSPTGDEIDIPDFNLPNSSDDAAPYDEKDIWIVDQLARMSEATAHLRHDTSAGAVALYYEEILPVDFPPLLVLDASGSLRLSYEMWNQGRHNLTMLPSPGKTYRNLTVRHWRHAAGKTAHVRNETRSRLAAGVAEAVAQADPADPILIIVRKPAKPYQNMEQEIREAVEKRFVNENHKPPALEFLTWGRHLAVNDYAHVKHVIVVGLLRYTASQAEAMARASGGLKPTQHLTEPEIDAFHRSEIAHHLFQAAGRGAIRKAVDGDVPIGCRLDVIFCDQRKRSIGLSR
ncbi:hypothetical protein MPL1032_60032 [Mesorhizobium plurifarium]|uniref:Helicase/UvrB N-terminal domain-containing protein n=1 Tax=Mesorhizobium plurifarium TaxID=69974 RepID=A0A0K2W5Y3_MESPL|nr:hypothetical protein MPL1032_60032 [Mesorhizobium plurifarium]